MNPGNTPALLVDGVFVKLECANPCGSIKDRIAKYIIEESERRGLLKPGMKIVEASSGNTGIALSYYGREKGYQVVIVMPENMTEERKKAIRGLDAELILCRAGDFAEAARIRDEIAQSPEYFCSDQFANPLNVECHERTTGVEILEFLNGKVERIDAFVAGVGTGGTLMGVGNALRKKFPELHLVAVEPSESAVMSGGSPGIHGISGIGDGFIPAIVSDGQSGIHSSINEIVQVPTEEAKEAALKLQERHGSCVGISSGANFMAAKKLAKRFQTVVTIFPDGYYRYQSQGLQHCKPGHCKFETQRHGVL